MSADNEVSNIEKDIDAGVEKIFIACRDKLVLEKVIALVEGLSPVIKEKTVVCLVQKVVSEVQSYVQHRRNNG
jgi:hypothetical protein